MQKALFYLLLFTGSWAYGQSSSLKKIDSLKTKFSEDSARIWRKTIAKPFLKVENRYSFISKEQVNLLGFMAGATFYNRHTFFGGYYFIDPRIKSPFEFETDGTVTHHYLNLSHFVAGYQYVVFNKRFLQLNMPLMVGAGTYELEKLDSDGNVTEQSKGAIWPMSIGPQLIIKPLKWLGFSASGGYRYIPQPQNTVIVLQGWYYSFGLWLEGRHIYRSMRYHHKLKLFKRSLQDAINNP
jgi:hypothetical protein